MNAGASAAGRSYRQELVWVSALFDSREAVDSVLVRLHDAGVPRDLIEVVVSPAAARRIYGGAGRPPRRQTLRYAGIGALAGVVAGATLSLVLVAWPGLDAPGGLAVVQLLGPNMTTILGAVLGSLAGVFAHRRPLPRHRRAGEAEDAAVVLVAGRSREEAEAIMDLLRTGGGREPRVEASGAGATESPE